jgi:hypothetical protein
VNPELGRVNAYVMSASPSNPWDGYLRLVARRSDEARRTSVAGERRAGRVLILRGRLMAPASFAQCRCDLSVPHGRGDSAESRTMWDRVRPLIQLVR